MVALLYIPHVFMTWKEQPGVNLGNLMQIMVFFLVAVATGLLSDRERERNRSMMEAQNLAALGRATMAMTAELQEVLKTLRVLRSSPGGKTDRTLDESLSVAVEKISTLGEILSQFRPGRELTQGGFVEVAGAIERARQKTALLAKLQGIIVQSHVDAASGLLPVDQGNLVWMIEELLPSEPNGSTTAMK